MRLSDFNKTETTTDQQVVDVKAYSAHNAKRDGKNRVTVRDLLLHMSGLRPDVDLGHG